MADESKELNENGEPKISKAAAKKAAKKAEKAEKKAAHQAAKPASEPKAQRVVPQVATGPSLDVDPMDAVFKVGWLKDVYNIKPAGEKVRTRFPPEPNGFLHIGHAKAIAVNFGFAKFHGGKCYLRYDDTNPEKEEDVYFKAIKETIEWLGYKPYQTTHSSDNFDRLYELAEILVKRGKAYACSCTAEEMNLQRGGPKHDGQRYECPHRNRPVEESLQELRNMKDRKYKAKDIVLRMKQDIIGSGNTYMWDLPAYRLTGETHHAMTGDKWVIYPTYDFAHCLCDSFEEITHSLCTTEFRMARESYDWLVDELKDELPVVPQQREYGRLELKGILTSKRKILNLVNNGIVRSWDDPRLYTLLGLRRRGIPPGAIRTFVAELGVSDSKSEIQLVRFDTSVRKYLEKTVPRLMLVPDPIKVIIDDLPEDHCEEISVEFMRGNEDMGKHTIPFTRTVYIDRSDFREEGGADFYRLAPGGTVGLLNVKRPIRATSFKKDPSTGLITEIHATSEEPSQQKGWIQWVAESPRHKSPIKAEVRIFNSLFKSEDPEKVEGGYMNDINPKSEEIFKDALIEVGFQDVKERAPWPKDHTVPNLHPGPWDVRFQGMRVAYFAVDTDSTDDHIILNKIVSLKEDTGKSA